MAVSDCKEEVHVLTRAEAVTLIKRMERVKGTKFWLSVSKDAPIVDKPDHVFAGAMRLSLLLSRAQAIDLVKDAITDALETRGGRVSILQRTYISGSLAGKVSFWL